MNLKGEVPVFKHGDIVVAEINDIDRALGTLTGLWGPPLNFRRAAGAIAGWSLRGGKDTVLFYDSSQVMLRE